MNITVQPQHDYEVLKLTVKAQHPNADELVVFPQDRIGYSGASIYMYYVHSRGVKTYSKPHFIKIHAGDVGKRKLNLEITAFNQFVQGFLSNVQEMKGPFDYTIHGTTYTAITSAAVGTSGGMSQVDSRDGILPITTIDSMIRRYPALDAHDKRRMRTKLLEALDHTFNVILKPWIGSPFISDLDKAKDARSFAWGKEYGWYLRWDSTRTRLSDLLGKDRGATTIDINGQRFVNPLYWLEQKVLNEEWTGKCRVVHGDLHLRNIMVASDLETINTNVIDFGWTHSESHCLKDYVLLEFSIKLLHLSSQLSDADTLEFEEALRAESLPPKLKRSDIPFYFDLILKVRTLSKSECDINLWTQEYHTALLLVTAGSLGLIGFPGLDERAVRLSIASLAQHLCEITESGPSLASLGEKRLLDEVILSRLSQELSHYNDVVLPLGDDCAGIRVPKDKKVLLTSTDPCPLPVAWILGDRDYYHYGWYTGLINLSDLAAMGGVPLGLMLACVMPNGMRISDYERFMNGVLDICNLYRCPIVGGNVKDGKEFTVNGSILGVPRDKNLLKRTGALAKHRLVVIGRFGEFWSAVLELLQDSPDLPAKQRERHWQKVRSPHPKLEEGGILASFASACMDSSDGLTGCFYELSRKNNLSIVIDHSSLTRAFGEDVERVASANQIDPLAIALSWGDWQLVCAVPASRMEKLHAEIAKYNAAHSRTGGTALELFDVGQFRRPSKQVPRGVFVQKGSNLLRLRNIENERFNKASYFSHGLESYIEHMKAEPMLSKLDNAPY